MKGTVKWYDKQKGYGFIVDENEKEYFVHYSGFPNFQESIRKEDLVKVEFEELKSDRGLQATNVVLVKEEAKKEE